MLQLWSDDVEGMRAEARAVVAAGLAFMAQQSGAPELPPMEDALARAAVVRAVFDRMGSGELDPDAQQRSIAGVPCRVFLPDGAPTAVYLHFHGGGMILGAPAMNDVGNRALARDHGLAVVSVDYRLAPEHAFPAGVDDCVAVAGWLVEHAEAEFGTPRLLVGGESAGGYLTAAVLLRVRDELGAADRFLGANLVFGVFDWGGSPSQRGIRPNDGPDMLDPSSFDFFVRCYLPGRSADERRDPAVSPLFADLRALPPALFSVGTADHLLDDTLQLAPRWAAANGGAVELFVAPDMPHGFIAFPCAMTARWAEVSGAWFRRVLAAD